ncbi:hypothetical protein HDU76_002718 [Blyttiomyces sp. JEL0837]|nr:hypothetical protein HDU76_002718 [Blyttiomyces sp. JEL0837]
MSTSTTTPTKLAPPFTFETATAKVQRAQDLWNTKDPYKVAPAYTTDTIWRNRDTFLKGREAVITFLQKKWSNEDSYRLRKELFCFSDDKIAVQFWYEWKSVDEKDGKVQWWRTYGLEDWTFDAEGLMKERRMSGNDVKILESERWFRDGSLERGSDPAPLTK